MPRITEEESRELAKNVAQAMIISETNGVFKNEDHSTKPRFDGTINLGHLLTIATLGIGMLTVYVNGRVTQADHEARLKAVEVAQMEFKLSLAKMTEVEAQTARNQDKIALTLEYLSKKYIPDRP